ncbi:MAG: undecaprenyldiphospho-muramoylpentapeptide beta-N-acetylglucosaminyltransferase [Bacteroides sp.]|nr:undecaprenyldiphospho-muramoylpentapeptide beta-N-acetylglucosaminyltransferase [Bacteroides sp.]
MALRIIISGGGTGGHIFPAISIANAIRELEPDTDILFVGAEGKMEMQRVPDAGYRIIGLPVAGFDRKKLWKNIGVLWKLMISQRKARKIIRDFRPQVAVGVGGYASGPTLNTAESMGIPTLIQEQNSYAGVTNKLLARKARKICVAYEGMERFFPADKIILTGNPVRQELLDTTMTREEAVRSFGLDPEKRVILILGGSLGARTINQTFTSRLAEIAASDDVQFIWQTGKIYYPEVKETVDQWEDKEGKISNLYVSDFIRDMAQAYTAADLVISRAGAGSISEFCLLHKAVILVPSPNVSEDHQTKNAMTLVGKEAAICVTDAEARDKLLETALATIHDNNKLESLSSHIATLALPDSARIIAQEVIALAREQEKK